MLLTVAYEDKGEPAVSTLYHLSVLVPDAVADKTTLEFLHPDRGTVLITEGEFTIVAIAAILVADVPLQLVASA